MKFIEVKCPCCSAPLEYTKGKTTYVCEYCQTTFVVNQNEDIKNDKKDKKEKKRFFAKLGVSTALLATAALVVSVGFKSIMNRNINPDIVRYGAETSYEVAADNEIEETQIIDYNTSYSLDDAQVEGIMEDSFVFVPDLRYLSDDIDVRAQYLADAYKEYGIINSATNKYYTSEEIKEYINYLNGDLSCDDEQAELMFNNLYTYFFGDMGISYNYINAVNDYLNPEDGYTVAPYYIKFAEAIINDKNSRLFPLVKHFDDLHMCILSEKDDYIRSKFCKLFEFEIGQLVAGDLNFNGEHYSIDEFNNEENPAAQVLLRQYVVDVIPFCDDASLSVYFNSWDENSYLNIIRDRLVQTNSDKNLSI